MVVINYISLTCLTHLFGFLATVWSVVRKAWKDMANARIREDRIRPHATDVAGCNCSQKICVMVKRPGLVCLPINNALLKFAPNLILSTHDTITQNGGTVNDWHDSTL